MGMSIEFQQLDGHATHGPLLEPRAPESMLSRLSFMSRVCDWSREFYEDTTNAAYRQSIFSRRSHMRKAFCVGTLCRLLSVCRTVGAFSCRFCDQLIIFVIVFSDRPITFSCSLRRFTI